MPLAAVYGRSGGRIHLSAFWDVRAAARNTFTFQRKGA
jgi:hypothetical protein